MSHISILYPTPGNIVPQGTTFDYMYIGVNVCIHAYNLHERMYHKSRIRKQCRLKEGRKLTKKEMLVPGFESVTSDPLGQPPDH